SFAATFPFFKIKQMRPIWKNHWLLFRSTHSQKSPEKRDFVVHTQIYRSVRLFLSTGMIKKYHLIWKN
ncbi:MAG: hypothetical protein MRZ09_08475, partial [Coprobacillus sp.]|nr:hypothetical protein [Coprobacillus sp.]